MKATLRFTLPEERSEYNDALNGAKWKDILFDFDQWMRAELKYKDKPADLQTARDRLSEFISDAGLDMYEE